MKEEQNSKVEPRSSRSAVAFLGAVVGVFALTFISYMLLSCLTQRGFDGSPVMLLMWKLPEGSVLGAVTALCWQHSRCREFKNATRLSTVTGALVLFFSTVLLIWGDGDFPKHEKNLWLFSWLIGSFFWSLTLFLWGVRQHFRLR